MLQSEVFVVEFISIVDAFATTTVSYTKRYTKCEEAWNRLISGNFITSGEVTSLEHELWDDSVKARSLVVQVLALLSNTLLARTQTAKILGTFGCNILAESHGDSAFWSAVDGDIKENCWIVCHFGFEASEEKIQRNIMILADSH